MNLPNDGSYRKAVNEETDAEVASSVMSQLYTDASFYGGVEVEKGLKGAIIGAINNYAGGNKNRRLLLGYLFAREESRFDELSTKELAEKHWFALFQWVQPWKDEDDNQWKTRFEFPGECVAVYHCAVVDYDADCARVRDPMFEPDGTPSSITRFLLDQGGTIADVKDGEFPEVVKRKSLLDGTMIGEKINE